MPDLVSKPNDPETLRAQPGLRTSCLRAGQRNLGRAPEQSSLGAAPSKAKAQSDNKKAKGAARRRRRRLRSAWRSPLTRRIMSVNAIVILILAAGLLHLDQYRRSLVSSEFEAMAIQANTLGITLGNVAAIDWGNGEQELSSEKTRGLLRVLVPHGALRARVFDRFGFLIGDSHKLNDLTGSVEVEELPPVEDDINGFVRWLGRWYDWFLPGLPSKHDLPLYRENRTQSARDYPEAGRALIGEGAAELRVDSSGVLMLSVAAPIQRYRQVLGVMMISKDGAAIERFVAERRQEVLGLIGFAFLISLFFSYYLSRTIARPIRDLADAADRVTGRIGSTNKRTSIPDLTHLRDEIGDLSGALKEMTEALHDRLEAIEGFAADVSHEIKNPLTSLRSAVETVQRIDNPEQQQRLIAIIADDVQRLDRLISDISDASRLDAELARESKAEVSLQGLVEAHVEVLSTTLGEDGPVFSVKLPDGDIQVPGIEGRLGQVMRNLLTNAVSFSPEGGRIELMVRKSANTLRVGAGHEPQMAVVTVSDQGPGIPENKLESIFERFYSERPHGEKFGTHSGLGLSISRQIVEAHGGTLQAVNRPEGGACFIVNLPLNR